MMDKENPARSSRGRPGYVAALVQRKQQQEAAAQAVAAAGDGKAPLPRVAVLGSQLRSSIVGGASNRQLSSLRNPIAQPSQSGNPSVRPRSASAQRTGCKPATHSTRTLVPLLDAQAASRARLQASASQAPAFSLPSSFAIGDPGLDEEEQQLQAELALYDQQLERIHEQKSQRRSATPDQRAGTPGVSSGPAAADQQQVQVQAQAEQEPDAVQLDPEPQPEAAEEAGIPAAELSIVRAVTTATGTGCKDIIAPHGAAALPAGACWTTRGHRVLRLESSAILQLWGRSTADITLRITFADAASVPRVVRLEHALTPTAPFALLGDIRLQPKSLTQLRHLFRLGKHLEVQRCLRITLMGHMAEEHSGAHRVSHMLLTSGLGPQRALPSQSAGAAPAAASAAQPSVYHSVQSMPAGTLATADSADSGDRILLELTSAAPALSEQQQQQAPAGSGLEPRVPPLALAAMLADGATTQQLSEPAFAAATLPAAPTEPPPQSEELACSYEQRPSEPAEKSQSAAEPESATAAIEQAAAASALPRQSVSVSWHEEPAEAAEVGCAALDQEAESVAAVAAVAVGHSVMEGSSQMAADSAQFASRTAAVEGAAALLNSACWEVQQSELLRTLLRVALLAGNFLNAGNRDGAAAGFQIDALLKLKDVRSTRARSRTLLHFVAREVARQHPAGASLIAALPSAAAAAQLDLPAAQAELAELTAAVQGAAALGRLQAAQAQMEQAEEAFKQLGGFINGQRSTMDAPRAFFGVLHAFAAELDAAHEENSAADAAAADKGGSGRKDGKQRHRSQSGSPASSATSGEQPRRRRDRAQESSHLAEGAQSEAALDRLKQQVAESRRPSAAAEDVSSGSRPRHHSPQPCLSKTAVVAVGGSRRPAQPSSSASQAGERQAADDNQAVPAAVRSSCPPAAMAAALAGQASAAPPVTAQAAAGSGDQQDDKLSTPIVSLLAESARLITSLDCGEPGFVGFGSALGSEAAGSSSATTSGTQGTASTPDGAARPAEASEADADYSTPRGAVSLRWQGQQARHAAGAVSGAEAQLSAAVPAAVGAGAGERLSVNLLRQRSLQQLSPTSTPLSSLGRQSSRSSGGYSSSYGSTPPSSMRLGGALGMMVRRSSSPLGLAAAPGLGAAVVAAEAAAAAARGRGTVAAAPGSLFSPELTSTPSELPDAQRLSTPPDSAPTGATSHQQPAEQQQPTAQWAAAAAALRQQQEHWESLPSPPVPGQPAAAAPVQHEGAHEEEEEALPAEQQAAAAALPAGFGALHSAASSFDLTFYAPFSMDRQGQSAFLPAQQARGGLSASLPCGQDLAGVWGPLAAEQQRQRLRASGGSAAGHASVDDLALPRAGAAAGGRKRVSFSLPNSPRRGAADLSAPGTATHVSRQPPPLNLAGLAGRLQVQPPRGSAEGGTNNSTNHSSAGGGIGGGVAVSSAAQYLPQLSPVLEALLGSVPTPLPPGVALAQPAGRASLAAGDLADMAGYSSDQEDEWQQLERIQQQDAEWQRQQAAERERREALRLGQSLRQSLRQSSGNPYLQAQAAMLAEAPAGSQQRALGQEQHQQGQYQQRVHLDRELAALQQQRQAEEAAEQGRHQGYQQQQQQWQEQSEEEEGEEERAALQQLPSPLNSATSDLDVAVARLLASAGNTPSGPLCQGVRQAEACADVQERQAAAPRASADGLPGGRRMALLEPVMPAPLGEGVRASRGMAQRVPAAALRMSLEGPLATTLRGAASAPEATLSQAAAAWQAAAAAGGYGEEGQGQHQQARGATAYRSVQGADWGGGYGPARRRPLRSLRRFLGRQY